MLVQSLCGLFSSWVAGDAHVTHRAGLGPQEPVPGAMCHTGLHPPRRAQAAEEGAEGASCHRCVLDTAVTTGLAGTGEGREHSCFGVGTLRGLAQA